MTVVADRIARLRALMAEKGIDAYVVPTADFHQSEYVGEHFKARRFITGFSGSYGTAVIGKDDAGLWTDGRYFFQAEHEMEGSGVRLMKMFVGDTPSVTEWLASYVPKGGKVGFDGRVLSPWAKDRNTRKHLRKKVFKSITQKISLIRSGKTARHFLTNRHFSWKKSTVEKALYPN